MKRTQAKANFTEMSLAKNQQGVALIMVMIVLVLVSILSVYAFRQSSVDLSIATATQVQELVTQTADIAPAKFEELIRSGRAEDTGNLIGTLRLGKDYEEIIFCVDSTKTRYFDENQFTWKVAGSPAGGGYKNNYSAGYCDPKTDFVSSRKATINQMIVKKEKREFKEAFSDESRLSLIANRQLNVGDSSGQTDSSEYIETNSTAIVPAYSTAKTGQPSDATKGTVSGCLKQGSTKATIDTCLKELGVPYETHVQKYMYKAEGIPKVSAKAS